MNGFRKCTDVYATHQSRQKSQMQQNLYVALANNNELRISKTWNLQQVKNFFTLSLCTRYCKHELGMVHITVSISQRRTALRLPT